MLLTAGITNATTVSPAATGAALLANRQRNPSSGAMPAGPQRALSDPEVCGGDDCEREADRKRHGKRERGRLRRIDDVDREHRVHRHHREDSTMLVLRHPAEPVTTDKENRRETNGEIPSIRRPEPGRHRAEIVRGRDAECLVWNSWHPRNGHRHDHKDGKHRGCSDRHETMNVGAGEHRGSKNRSHAGDDRTATTVDPSRCEHRPRRRGHERDAEPELDHGEVTAGRRPSPQASPS